MRRTSSTPALESTAHVKLRVDNVNSEVDDHKQNLGSKI